MLATRNFSGENGLLEEKASERPAASGLPLSHTPWPFSPTAQRPGLLPARGHEAWAPWAAPRGPPPPQPSPVWETTRHTPSSLRVGSLCPRLTPSCPRCCRLGCSSVCLSRCWSALLWPCCPEPSEHPFCVWEGRGGPGTSPPSSGLAGSCPPGARRVGGAGGVRLLEGVCQRPQGQGPWQAHWAQCHPRGRWPPGCPVVVCRPRHGVRERLGSVPVRLHPAPILFLWL